mmetsp:Transcript_8039/g.13693  ORF Transcript_8039/g.13693 Transcript_8039/m.13693 type:complete len:105 (-) Transcript_8039:806-1120(-)
MRHPSALLPKGVADDFAKQLMMSNTRPCEGPKSIGKMLWVEFIQILKIYNVIPNLDEQLPMREPNFSKGPHNTRKGLRTDSIQVVKPNNMIGHDTTQFMMDGVV